jgi:1-deoxyxylulose-5-phosphate synthase
MDYINLGNTGLKVSRICLGCMTYGSPATGKLLPGRQPWALSETDSVPFLRQALDLGINFFDTANVYSGGDSEIVVGRFLKANTRREAVVIATKVCSPMREEPNGRGLSRKEIVFELEESLKRLETDYVDLYQIHRWDYETPIEETLEALHDMVKAGKVRYIGGSSMYAWQFAKSLYASQLRGWTRFVSMQNHYNLIYREEEREMNPLCRDQGIGIIPWSPLARGFLAGNRKPKDYGETIRAKTDDYAQKMYYQPSDFTVVERLTEIARKLGVSNAQVALAWMLAQPGITAPIVGASKMQHLDDAVAALRLKLSEEDLKALGEPYLPHPVLGHG